MYVARILDRENMTSSYAKIHQNASNGHGGF